MAQELIKVLLVDDNRIIRHLLHLTFSNQARYQLFEADSGEQALPIVLRERPEIILLDILMPGELDGVELCRMIKSWEDCRKCKIVFLSGCGQQQDLKLGMEAGADLYIIKPFSPIQLLASVEKLLDIPGDPQSN